MTESALLRSIRLLLHERGALGIRINVSLVQGHGGAPFWSAPRGTADLLCCYRGHFLAIEAKAATRQRPEQAAFQRAVERAGGIYLLAYDIETVQKCIDSLA